MIFVFTVYVQKSQNVVAAPVMVYVMDKFTSRHNTIMSNTFEVENENEVGHPKPFITSEICTLYWPLKVTKTWFNRLYLKFIQFGLNSVHQ